MSAPTRFIGLDLDSAARKFDASIGTTPWKLVAGPAAFADSLDGFQELLAWLRSHQCAPAQTVLCMEATGFLGEPLAYFLAAQGYRVAIEPLVKVRRPFRTQERDQSSQDSRQLAEYAYHCLDNLRVWQPSIEKLEQIKALLTTCEQLPWQPIVGRKETDTHVAEQDRQRGMQSRHMDLLAVDNDIRQLLKPHPTVADEWPYY